MQVGIPERIKEVRKTLGLSQEEFGARIGVSRDVVGNIEYDRLKKPEQKEPVYKLICSKFSVSEHWLKTGDGEPFTGNSDNVVQFSAAHPNMSDVDKAVMEAYFSLSEEQKEAFLQYCLSVAEAWKAQNGKKNTAVARSGDRVDVAQVSAADEEAALPPEYSGDI